MREGYAQKRLYLKTVCNFVRVLGYLIFQFEVIISKITGGIKKLLNIAGYMFSNRARLGQLQQVKLLILFWMI